MYMRASLDFFLFSHSKTATSFNILLILQILCRYKLHAFRLTCLYLQISKCTNKTPKTHCGAIAPPHTPLATLVHFSHCQNRFDTYLYIIVHFVAYAIAYANSMQVALMLMTILTAAGMAI